jgi:hypothetical protein
MEEVIIELKEAMKKYLRIGEWIWRLFYYKTLKE